MEHLTPGPPRAHTRAPTVFCYICGRQYGSKSIGIHQPQCLEKWRRANEKLPKNQRRPEPVEPEIIRVGGQIDFEATNAAAYETALAQRSRCENCGRAFATDRLEIHQRSCTAENPSQPVGALKVRRDPPMATSKAATLRKNASSSKLPINNFGDSKNTGYSKKKLNFSKEF